MKLPLEILAMLKDRHASAAKRYQAALALEPPFQDLLDIQYNRGARDELDLAIELAERLINGIAYEPEN